MSEAIRKRIDELRMNVLNDISPDELSHMQVKVDALMRLAMLDASHDHDTVGGVGHHDHKALPDLSWRLDPARDLGLARKIAETKKGG